MAHRKRKQRPTFLQAAFESLVAPLQGEQRWVLEGWMAHLAPTRHQLHAANSWAKHIAEFGHVRERAEALVVACCLDFGMKRDDVMGLLRDRIAAKASGRAEDSAAAPSR